MSDDWPYQLVDGLLRRQGLWPRYSRLLVWQVVWQARGGLDPHQIAVEIGRVDREHFDGFKPPDTFRFEPLKGLFKAHILGQNTCVELLSNMQLHNKRYLKSRLFKELRGRFGTRLTNDDLQKIAKIATDGAINERARNNQLTGDWVVFDRPFDRPLQASNRYLCLAQHYRGDPDDMAARKQNDEFIFSLATAAQAEFRKQLPRYQALDATGFRAR
jgi:hypothetical protein